MPLRTSSVATVVLTAICSLAFSPSARAAGAVAPGQTLSFANPDYGTRQCRTGKASDNTCLTGAGVGTGWNVNQHRARALVMHIGPATVLPPMYAQGMLHNEFVLGGAPGHFVNTQVSVDYDINPAQILIAANAYAEVSVMLQVRDITQAPGFNVTTHTLYQLRRDNTQGVTDVAGAQERQLKLGESGHFDVMLLTGRKYAVSFVVEAMNGGFSGGGDTRVDARWNRLSISVDEDEVELIDDLAVALQQHDIEMKKRLDVVDAKLNAIRMLLQTPQGRREGWRDP